MIRRFFWLNHPFHWSCTQLKTVDSFKYIGSVISANDSLDKEIATRISKASQALGRMRARVLNQHNIRLSTKLKVCKAVVLPSLLYGCETWTLYRKHTQQLGKFHMRSLRSTLGIQGQGDKPGSTGQIRIHQHRGLDPKS